MKLGNTTVIRTAQQMMMDGSTAHVKMGTPSMKMATLVLVSEPLREGESDSTFLQILMSVR